MAERGGLKDVFSSSPRQYKATLAEALVEHISPIRERMSALLEDRGHVEAVLARGEAEAEAIARPGLEAIKATMGLR